MDYAAMGRRIRQLRLQKELTQAALAEEAEISTAFVGYIERGTRVMSLETFARLCQTLGADAEWLLGISENGNELQPREELLKLLERSAQLVQRI